MFERTHIKTGKIQRRLALPLCKYHVIGHSRMTRIILDRFKLFMLGPPLIVICGLILYAGAARVAVARARRGEALPLRGFGEVLL